MKHSEQGTVGLGRRSMRRWFSILALTLLAGVASAVNNYTWVGNVSSNWNLAANWSPSTGYPGSNTTDNAWITNVTGSAYAPSLNQNLTINNLYLTSTTGTVVNQSGTYQTLTINGGLVIATPFAATNLLYPVIYGSTFGIGMTSSVLVLESSANSFLGGIAITGGVLDVSASVFSTNGLNAAGASNSTPVVLGDLNAGLNAEVRVKGGSGAVRGIVVEGGAGTRTIRFVGASSAFYTNAFVLSNTVVMAPGYLTDSPGANTYTINNPLTGTGGVTVANGAGIILLTATNDTYTGPVTINAGTLQMASSLANTLSSNCFGNQQITLGDTSGNNNATLQLASGTGGTTNIIVQSITVATGSTGVAALDVGGMNEYGWLEGPITLNKMLTLKTGSYNNNTYITNGCVFSGPGGLTIATKWSYTSYGSARNGIVHYCMNTPPAYTGGTTISYPSSLATLIQPYWDCQSAFYWDYTGTGANDTELLSFGSTASGSPAPITLNNGRFRFNSLSTGTNESFTLKNPILVQTNQFAEEGINELEWYFVSTANYGTMIYTGPMTLGNYLEITDGGAASDNGYYQGNIGIDQSAGGRRGFWINRANFTSLTLSGSITDNVGSAANSLIVRSSLPGGSAAFTSPNNTFANGTLMEGDYNYTVGVLLNIQSASGSFGLGDIWLQEGALLQLNQASHLASGASMTLYSSQPVLSVLGLGGNFLPQLTSDSSGVVAINTNTYTAITSQALVGNGMMYLGSTANGTFTGPSLAPGSDGIYRLGGGNGTLTIANSALIATNLLQVGAPAAISAAPGTLTASTYGNGSGTVILQAANAYSGTVVQAGCTLQGAAQNIGSPFAYGSPFGNTNAPVTLNGGTIQLNGNAGYASNITQIGALTINGCGTIVVTNCTTHAIKSTLYIASLPAQSTNTPWTLSLTTLSGKTASGIGDNTRVVPNSGAPATTNGMLPPYFTAFYTMYDFVSNCLSADAYGVTGFTNLSQSSSAYTLVTTGAGLNALTAGTAVVLLSAGITNDGSVSPNIYALNIKGGTIITNSAPTTITIGSGGILCTAGINIFDTISFGNSPGYLRIESSNVGIYTNLIGPSGLVKSGSTVLSLYGSSPQLTGTIAVVQGALYGASDAAFGAPANPFYLAGGGILELPTMSSETRPITLGLPGGTIAAKTSVAGPTNIASTITGPGQLELSAAVAWAPTITNQNNTYSGGTLVAGANYLTLSVAPNATMGVGDVAVVQNAPIYLYGDHNIGGGDIYGNNTTNRQARLTIEPCEQNGGGNLIGVYFMSANPSVGSLSGAGVVFMTNTTLTVGGDNSSTFFSGFLYQCGNSSGGTSTGQIYKVGSGRFVFKGTSFLLGTNTVNNGTLEVDGYMPNAVVVNNGGTLAGAGTVGAVTLNSGGVFMPGNVTNAPTVTKTQLATLITGGLSLTNGATVVITINSASNYTQINAGGGAVSLIGAAGQPGATLLVNMAAGYAPSSSDTFTIITNAASMTGTFAGLPNNSLASLANGYTAKITYTSTAVTLSNLSRGATGSTLLFW